MKSKLRILHERLNRSRGKYELDIAKIEQEVSKIIGIDGIDSNDFPGDGLGIGVNKLNPPRGLDVYAPIETLIKIHEKTGRLTIDDIQNNLSL